MLQIEIRDARGDKSLAIKSRVLLLAEVCQFACQVVALCIVEAFGAFEHIGESLKIFLSHLVVPFSVGVRS